MERKERRSFTMDEKVRILEKVDSFHGTRVALARELNISVSTLNTIVKNRDSITSCASDSGPNAKKRKYATYSKYDDLEDTMKRWFETSRAAGIPVGSVLLREKALQVASILGIENFSASNGWIDRFRKRYNITYRTVCGESKDVDNETVQQWVSEKLQTLIANYEPKDVFNIDETGLFFNVLPNKTLAFKGDKCHGGKHSKLRLTVMLGANADGSEKLQPFVIGKSKKPRCFQNVRSLPTPYDANQKAWMTSHLFRKQLAALDAKMGAQNRKILLFVDRCPAHPIDMSLRNVQLEFFPANCTSKLQPMDLGVIHSFKSFYRKNLVQRLLSMSDSGLDISSTRISVLKALHFIAKSWKAVKEDTIKNCFLKAGFFKDTGCQPPEEGEEELLPAEWEMLQPNCTFNEFLEVDNNIITAEEITVEELAAEKLCATGNSSLSDEEEDDDGEEEIEPVPSSVQATAAVDLLQRYFSSVEGNEKTLETLYELEKQIDFISNKRAKQKSITDFFCKKQ